jgi:hypothetical protein
MVFVFVSNIAARGEYYNVILAAEAIPGNEATEGWAKRSRILLRSIRATG